MHQRLTTRSALGIPVLLVLTCAAPSLAQEGPLAGPTVEKREVPGVRAQYVPGMSSRMAGPEQAVPLGAFLQALKELRSTDAPQGVRLSPEQAQEIAAAVGEFRTGVVGFLENHAIEVRRLIQELPESQRAEAWRQMQTLQQLREGLDRLERSGNDLRGLNRRGPADKEPAAAAGKPSRAATDTATDTATDAIKEPFVLRLDRAVARTGAPDDSDPMGGSPGDARDMTATGMEGVGNLGENAAPSDRLAQLRALAPSGAALQVRVWEKLTPEQQEAFGAALESYMRDQRAQREERRLQQLSARLAEGSDAPARTTDAERATMRRRAIADAGAFSGQLLDRIIRVLEETGEIPDQVRDRLPARMLQRLENLPQEERAEALATALRRLRGDSNPSEER